MNNIHFDGPFQEVALLYIEYKKSLGYDCLSEVSLLKNMNTFFKIKGITQIQMPQEIVEQYIAKKESESFSTQAKRITLIKQFAIFLTKLGYEDIHVTNTHITKADTRFRAHIYTQEQIQKIFSYLDNNYIAATSTNDIILPLLIRIAYSCGLRKDELLSLTVKDIDLTQNIITVNNSKGNVSRITPMCESLAKCCKKYIEVNNKNENDLLFCKRDGTKCSKHITKYFQKILKKLNIYKDDGSIPRLHDFRFTFAVNTLVNMEKKNQNLYTTLPILSKFMGHKDLESTEYYLSLTKEYYMHVIDKENEFYKGVLPEVDDENE